MTANQASRLASRHQCGAHLPRSEHDRTLGPRNGTAPVETASLRWLNSATKSERKPSPPAVKADIPGQLTSTTKPSVIAPAIYATFISIAINSKDTRNASIIREAERRSVSG